MYKTIEIEGKNVDFKCTAGTQFNYKRLFGKSLMDEFVKRTKLLREMEKAQKKAEELKEKNDTDAYIDFLADDTSAQDLIAFTTELIPQLAFVMYLEANYETREVYRNLNQEAFYEWLCNYDANTLLAHAGDFIGLWSGSNKTYSKLKNV